MPMLALECPLGLGKSCCGADSVGMLLGLLGLVGWKLSPCQMWFWFGIETRSALLRTSLGLWPWEIGEWIRDKLLEWEVWRRFGTDDLIAEGFPTGKLGRLVKSKVGVEIPTPPGGSVGVVVPMPVVCGAASQGY